VARADLFNKGDYMSFGGKVNSVENISVLGDGWPDLSTNEFRNLRRIPYTFDNNSIAAAINIAALRVQNSLARLLVDTVIPELNSSKTMIYKRAVYGRTHAELLPEFATQDRRKEGESVTTDDNEQEDRFLFQSQRDISLLLGESSIGISLI